MDNEHMFNENDIADNNRRNELLIQGFDHNGVEIDHNNEHIIPALPALPAPPALIRQHAVVHRLHFNNRRQN